MITLNGQNGITLNSMNGKPLAQSAVQVPTKADKPKATEKNDSFEKQTDKHSKLRKGAIIGGGAVVVLASVLGVTRHINSVKIKKLIQIKLGELDEIGNEIIANLKKMTSKTESSITDIKDLDVPKEKLTKLSQEFESIKERDVNLNYLGHIRFKVIKSFNNFTENEGQTEKTKNLLTELSQIITDHDKNTEKYREKFLQLNSDNFIINQPMKLFEKYHDELNGRLKTFSETGSSIIAELTNKVTESVVTQNKITNDYIDLFNSIDNFVKTKS